jgi:diketogulonate reductase-like aldo/keto reductase
MSVPSFKLNTGATIPAVGLGTWQAKPGEVRQAVAHALKSGYRHIDGALCYQVSTVDEATIEKERGVDGRTRTRSDRESRTAVCPEARSS